MSKADDEKKSLKRQVSVLQLLDTLITFLREILSEVTVDQAKDYLKQNPNQCYYNNFDTIENADLGALLIIYRKRNWLNKPILNLLFKTAGM